MNKLGDYNQIMSDKKLFYETIYTPLSQAIKILEERQKDKVLVKKIEELLNNDIPDPLKKLDKYGISGKQIATPNNDTRWFIKLVNEFGLKPVFFEYLDDKFTSNNDFKHSLGQIMIQKEFKKRGKFKIEKVSIIDFNKYDGKPLKDVKTFWLEPLAIFHRKLFEAYNINTKGIIFYDESNWLKKNGGIAKRYYEKDLLLYLCHGILFENFLLADTDRDFIKGIFLPAFEKIYVEFGIKPLIVPIPPMEIEEDPFWYFHDEKIKSYIKIS